MSELKIKYAADEVAFTNSDGTDVTYSSLLADLRVNCPCLNDATAFNDDELWRAYFNAVNYLSQLLCWNDTGCGNLFYGERSQLEEFQPGCGCDGKWLTINPLYSYNIDPDSIKLTLTIVGSNITRIEVPADEIEYIPELDIIRVNMNQTFVDTEGNSVNPVYDCDCCSKKIIANVSYKSGFDKLPECIIDTICKMVTYMFYSQCGASASDCSAYTKIHPNAYLVSEKNSKVSYTWQIIDSENAFQKMLNYFDEVNVYKFSNCRELINDYSGVIYEDPTQN